MSFSVPIPPPINKTQKCERCGLQYPLEKENCIHCKDLTDKELIELIQRKNEEHLGNANLGKLFLYIAILIVVGMLIATNT